MINKCINIFKLLILLMIGTIGCDESEEVLSENENQADETQVTYVVEISEILLQNCTYCHSTVLATGGVVLDTYEDARVVGQTGQLLGAITHAEGFTAMSLNAAMLPAEDINHIRTWIETEFPR